MSPEYNIFNPHKFKFHRVKQAKRVGGCLARRHDAVQCWLGSDNVELAESIESALKSCSAGASTKCGSIGQPLEACGSCPKPKKGYYIDDDGNKISFKKYVVEPETPECGCPVLNPLNPAPKLPREEYEQLGRGLADVAPNVRFISS